jgi:hypothetical protein
MSFLKPFWHERTLCYVKFFIRDTKAEGIRYSRQGCPKERKSYRSFILGVMNRWQRTLVRTRLISLLHTGCALRGLNDDNRSWNCGSPYTKRKATETKPERNIKLPRPKRRGEFPLDAATRRTETYSHHGKRYILVDGIRDYRMLHFKTYHKRMYLYWNKFLLITAKCFGE